MQKIIPHLWFDKQAEEASKFYVSLFENSSLGKTTRYGKEGFEIHGMAEGAVMTQEFMLAGQSFVALNGGSHFKLNPSISFIVVCKTLEEVSELWNKLSGTVRMELGEYPFSKKYGWRDDQYGLSWQVMLADDQYEITQKITPTLLFVGDVCGKAEEAMNFYASIFPDSKVGGLAKYPAGMEPDREGTIMHGAVTLAGQEFFAMDSAQKHDFTFNEAVSLLVNCKDQQEIDYYWEKLSAHPENEQCGWLKDKYGVSWQIVPEGMAEFFESNDKETVGRAMNAMLQMKKIDIAALERAVKEE